MYKLKVVPESKRYCDCICSMKKVVSFQKLYGLCKIHSR